MLPIEDVNSVARPSIERTHAGGLAAACIAGEGRGPMSSRLLFLPVNGGSKSIQDVKCARDDLQLSLLLYDHSKDMRILPRTGADKKRPEVLELFLEGLDRGVELDYRKSALLQP
ncbi:hypothetical protein PIB30_061318, partial [Stylosanthes scabra]|nr:hypothetical protein [Stylosanthes scabra]